MAWPFRVAFDDIGEPGLQALVTENVREGYTLEYKEFMYEKGRTVRLLRDVSAFANTNGGHIIIGVAEDSDASDGTPRELSGIDDADEAQRRIENACYHSIKPPIVGLRVRDVQLTSGRSVVVVFIPNSASKPHMVEHEGTRGFYARHERQCLPMSVDEIKRCVLTAYDTERARRDLLTQRRSDILRLAQGDAALWLYAVPLSLKEERINVIGQEFFDFLRDLPRPPSVGRLDFFPNINLPIPTLEGLEARSSRRGTPPNEQMRLERTGYLDYAHFDMSNADHDRAFRLSRAESVLYWWTHVVHLFNRKHLGGEPTVMGAQVLNAEGTWHQVHCEISPRYGKLHRDTIVLRELCLATETEWRLATKYLADQLYNAYHEPASPNFDSDGNPLTGRNSGASSVQITHPQENPKKPLDFRPECGKSKVADGNKLPPAVPCAI